MRLLDQEVCFGDPVTMQAEIDELRRVIVTRNEEIRVLRSQPPMFKIEYNGKNRAGAMELMEQAHRIYRPFG